MTNRRLRQGAEVDLKGRVALVTGASRGIGEYTAYELADHGVNVVVMARSSKETRSTRPSHR